MRRRFFVLVFFLVLLPASTTCSARELADFSYDTIIENAQANSFYLGMFNTYALAKKVDMTLQSKEPLPHKDKKLTISEQGLTFYDGNAQYSCSISYIFFNIIENRSPGTVFYSFDVREKCRCAPSPE
jgi:hypothetical protein